MMRYVNQLFTYLLIGVTAINAVILSILSGISATAADLG